MKKMFTRLDENVFRLEEAPTQINKLSKPERNAISNAFAKMGLDGNGRFETKGKALSAVVAALDSLGFNLDMVSGDIILGDQGSRMLLFRRKNTEGADAFDEQPEIANSRIVFTWELMGQNRFEVLAYAS